MTVARDFAAFLTGTSYDDLPAQAVDHAAMIISSTLASAACGRHIQSAAIVRELMQERGGDMLKMTPLRRLGTPEDVAGVAAFLCSDGAAFLTAETIHVNGGLYIASCMHCT